MDFISSRIFILGDRGIRGLYDELHLAIVPLSRVERLADATAHQVS
jgi:hypothetical protein